MTTGKTIALTRWTSVGKVMSLLFTAWSKLVIALLSRSTRLNFMAAVTVHNDFGAQKIKAVSFYCFPSHLPWSDGTRCHDLRFLNVEILNLISFFTLFFQSSSRGSLVPLLSAIKLVSSAYLRLLIFLLAILIPAHASSSLGFRMMYSACKLNKQGDNTALTYLFHNL